MDFYRRFARPQASDRESLIAGRAATIAWGVFATVTAIYIGGGDSLIEQVNKVGSFFYGTLLGGFLLALLVPRAGDLAAFVGLAAGMGSVVFVHNTWKVQFLWYNLLGAVAVVTVGALVALIAGRSGSSTSTAAP